MSEEWLREMLQNLQIEDRRVQTLSEIRDQLSQSPSIGSTISANLLGSTVIHNCIDTSSNNEQETLAYDIISLLLSNMDLNSSQLTDILEPSLLHRNHNVRLLALNELSRLLQRTPSLTTFPTNLVLAVITSLDSSETTVGAAAIEVLSHLLVYSYDNQEIKTNFVSRLEGSDVVRCRVYETAVNLARSSPVMLDKVEPILSKMIAELDSHDVLLQLNILELLVTLAEQNHGLVYLENRKVFQKVSQRVEQIDKDPFGSILIPGFMKFFGKIAYAQPQRIIIGYPDLLNRLFDCLLSGDLSVLPTALDTLGNLAHSSQGKIILHASYSNKMEETFRELGNMFRNLPTDLKVRAFNAFEVVFKTEGVASDEIREITKKWHSQLTGASDFRFLLEFCKNPFPEIKIACLSLVKSLLIYRWGMEALKQTAGFVEYLLDRRVEFDKNVLFLKYEINKILADTDTFDAHTILQLQKYVAEGVLYVQGVVEVAVDGS